MKAGIRDLIERHHLISHPEGGYYRELLRPGQKVRPADGRIRDAITAILFLLAVSFVRAVDFSSSNLPVAVIDTHGERIENQRRIDADLAVVDHGPGARNGPDDSPVTLRSRISIEIRGSSAVWQGWPKQSYAFETVDASGVPIDVPILGMPKENDWILYGPYTDKTFLRDALAYRISRDMGRYAPRTRFCELVLNGEYSGVYLFVEKIKRDANRVAIAKMDSADIVGDAVTGGYIIKVDREAGEENSGWTSRLSPSPDARNKVKYLYHYPRPSDIAPEQRTEIRRFMDSFETVMAAGGPGGLPDSLFDVDAFIDYILVNEITRNVDAYSLSTYMHKDRNSRDGRLKMGPAWDYNLGFGNADYYAGDSTSGWMIDRKVRLLDRIPFWVGALWHDAGIRARFNRRYRELRGGNLSTEHVFGMIDVWADTLAEAESRDHEKYPVLGVYVWPNPFVGETFVDEISHLREWIRERLAWMDGETTGIQTVRPEPNAGFELGMVYPNPFNPQVTVPILLEQPARVRVTVIDVRGRVCDEQDLGILGPGIHRHRWDASGLASGVYTLQVECGTGVRRRSAVFVR